MIWGSDWDPLLAARSRRPARQADGRGRRRRSIQKYVVEDGAYIREHFFGKYPRLLEMVEHLSDEQLEKLRRGGHDPVKVYAAYKAAVEHNGSADRHPRATIKGYGLGEAGEGKNITHQQKKMNEEELREFRTRFGIPISDEEIADAPFYRPPDDSPEMQYLRERRKALGGYVPSRVGPRSKPLQRADRPLFEEFDKGTERAQGVDDDGVRPHSVEAAARQGDRQAHRADHSRRGAHVRHGGAVPRQSASTRTSASCYEPVDMDTLLYYKEAKDGQILEEGITEAGSMSSFIAAGTAYATHGVNTIPFFIYYSMFGFQRVGDLIWAAADIARARLPARRHRRPDDARRRRAAAPGRPQPRLLAGDAELRAYDPAYAYELAVIIQDGIRRMYRDQESIFYYMTVMNEQYEMPPMPEGAREGI